MNTPFQYSEIWAATHASFKKGNERKDDSIRINLKQINEKIISSRVNVSSSTR